MPEVILVSGGTGVGKSRLCLELAATLGIYSVTSSDSVREVLRNVLHHDVNPAIGASTYEAGMGSRYHNHHPDIQKAQILSGYKLQARAVGVGIEGVIRRAMKENVSCVVEGVHLIPGCASRVPLSVDYSVREMHVAIGDPQEHRRRFAVRQRGARAREEAKYLQNFQEIRWVHDYLLSKAQKKGIIVVDNGGPVSQGVDAMLERYYRSRK